MKYQCTKIVTIISIISCEVGSIDFENFINRREENAIFTISHWTHENKSIHPGEFEKNELNRICRASNIVKIIHSIQKSLTGIYTHEMRHRYESYWKVF